MVNSLSDKFFVRYYLLIGNYARIKNDNLNHYGTGNLTHTKTRDIIPVDLNSFMYWNAKLLEKFCALVSFFRFVFHTQV